MSSAEVVCCKTNFNPQDSKLFNRNQDTVKKSVHEQNILTLKVPRKNASENVVCWSRLLQIIA